MTFMTLLSVGLLLAGASPVEPAANGAQLRIENSRVREAPPGVDVLAAYGQFCNDGENAVTLVRVGSADFDAVEMHETVETDGAVSMRQMENLVVSPNTCLAFAPGGRHFMLIGPKRPLHAGDTVEFTLTFAGGNNMTIVMPVQRAAAPTHHEHGHH